MLNDGKQVVETAVGAQEAVFWASRVLLVLLVSCDSGSCRAYRYLFGRLKKSF